MEQKIINFYADKGFHIPKMIERRPRDLTPEQVEAGAESIYLQMLDGLKIKKLNIARRVWEAGRLVNCAKYVEKKNLLVNAEEIIKKHEFMVVHYRKINRRIVILSGVLISLVIIEQALRYLL